MKQEHCNGLLWAEQNNAVVNVGLTPEFFKQSGHIWHIMPPRNKRILANGPLLSIITYDDMSSLRSPHAGKMTSFNRKASITPDKLSPDEVVLTLNTADLSEEEEAQPYMPGLGNPIPIRRSVYSTTQFRGVLDSLGANPSAMWANPFVTAPAVAGGGHVDMDTSEPEQEPLTPEARQQYENIRLYLSMSLQNTHADQMRVAVQASIANLNRVDRLTNRQRERLTVLNDWIARHDRGEF